MTMTTTPPPTPPAASSSSPVHNSGSCSSGIDIRDALSILSNRARGGGDVDTAAYSDGTVVPPTELKEMGQTIDMIVDPNANNGDNSKLSGCGCSRSNANDDSLAPHPPMDKDELARHELLKQERARRGEEIRMQLRSMAVADLLGMIFRAQEERVATYHLFEEGLSKILVSGNITTYPNLCAKVTASFSVLSDTINAVKSSLEENNNTKEDNGRKEISNFITQLQKCENDKLNLTAALHLERLRLRNLRVGDGDGEDNDVTMKLLTEGIRSLETKIASAVESINEVLEELRCIAAE